MNSEFTQIIKSHNFRDLMSEINEIILDSFLKEGLIKDIPFFGILTKALNLKNTIQERLYTKKLLVFLKEIEETDFQTRQKEIEKIDNNEKYKTKVGEKILYLINEADDAEKAMYQGILFKKFIEQSITYDNYIRCVNCVNRTNTIDLNEFIKEPFINSYIKNNYDNYLHTGLISQSYENPLNEYSKNKMISFKKAQIKYELSQIGQLIRNNIRKEI